jgi:hypothetical protein
MFGHNISATTNLINIIVPRSIETKAQRTEDRRRMTDKEGTSNFRLSIVFDGIEKGCVIRGIFLDGRDVDLV